ncbi:MAG: SRPBCC family protein [Nocardioides sp.]
MSNKLTVTAPEGLPYIDFDREFDAPVEAVFRAHQDPELLRQWMGPDGYEMDIDHHDFTDQGSYRFVHRSPDGEEYAFRGCFHTVRANEFAIQTFEYEGMPDQVSIEFLTLTDLGEGRTALHAHAVYPSLEARDAMVESGMETGASDGYDKLDELLASASTPA